jgi:choline kinase
MAGSGSRLRDWNRFSPKPLVQVLGRPLVSYTIDALTEAGITTIHAVIGFEGEQLRAGLAKLIPPKVDLHFIKNPRWQKKNGISLLTAATHVANPFLLSMSDHIYDHEIVTRLIKSANPNLLNVAIDRKLEAIFDLPDAMKVQTCGDRVIAIGKNLQKYDAIDTGLFVCPLEIFKYLEKAKQGGDCGLAEGVQLMATQNKVRAEDIGPAWWQDIDTPQMLLAAESKLRSSVTG